MTRRVMNLGHIVAQNGRRLAAHPAFIWGDLTLSWADLDAEVSALAAGLRARGIGKGDRILVHSKNCDAMFVSMFATFRIGAVWVPTNFRLLPDEVAYLSTSSGAKAFLCHGDFSDHAAAVAKAAPAPEFTWRIGPGAFGEDEVGAVIARHRGERVADVAVEHDDPCWFFFTSGTTGRSKAAVLTHGQMGFVITNHLCDLVPGTTEADCSLVVAPLSHGAGVHQLMLAARGAASILLPTERFDIDEAWRLIARHRVTSLFTVPTILKMLVEHPAVEQHDHSSLRYVIYAGAPMYREDQKRALATLGSVLVQYFGLGEVTGNITVLPPSLHFVEDGPHARVGSCGYARTAMQVNALSPARMAQTYFAKAASAATRAVIQITDMKIANPNPDFFSYTMSKHALASTIAMLAKGARTPQDRVYGIAPGAILASHDQSEDETELSHRMNLLGRKTGADEIARAALFLATGTLASGQSLFIDSGQHLLDQPRDVIWLARELAAAERSA
ncbi:MAG: hypothetical protein B7Z14_16695 [Bosea sp. 32-68-6]|nr:MAG: hypothetical protein B7Z14_16695 [Bosea sp. 32-68-6]